MKVMWVFFSCACTKTPLSGAPSESLIVPRIEAPSLVVAPIAMREMRVRQALCMFIEFFFEFSERVLLACFVCLRSAPIIGRARPNVVRDVIASPPAPLPAGT